jgi:hypothetical protein
MKKIYSLLACAVFCIALSQAFSQEIGKAPQAVYRTEILSQQEPVFEPNNGQMQIGIVEASAEIKYLLKANGLVAGFSKGSFSYQVYQIVSENGRVSESTGEAEVSKKAVKSHGVTVDFPGSNPEVVLETIEPASGYSNYYLSHCNEGIAKVSGYQKLVYRDLYPNIDLVLTTSEVDDEPRLKYDIIVRPGGNLADVKMEYNGMYGLKLSDGNTLSVSTSAGTINESIPYSYLAETNEEVQVNYELEGNTVSFSANQAELGNKTLVVDPEIHWSTYFGGSTFDGISNIAVGDEGEIYAIGFTSSGTSSFPFTEGAFQTQFGGFEDAFMVKFSASGERLWSTFLGGDDLDIGHDIFMGQSGDIFISGGSNSDDFPTTSGAYQEDNNGFENAFLARFSPDGSRVWATHIGGSSDGEAYALCEAPDGSVILAGLTLSNDFPTTGGAHQPDYSGGGGRDAFLCNFSVDGDLNWSTYFGGAGSNDEFWDVKTDASGNIFTSGKAGFSFPATTGAYDEDFNGEFTDGIACKFSADGSLEWATFLGGNEGDLARRLDLDSEGNVYIFGDTDSNNFPTTVGAYQEEFLGGSDDAFLSKFNTSGELLWSTFIGGDDTDFGNGIVISDSDEIYLTGATNSENYPVSSDAFQSELNSTQRAFVSVFSTAGDLGYSTFFGGNYFEVGSVAYPLDDCTFYLVGQAYSETIPVMNAFQPEQEGPPDAFFTKFSCDVNVAESSENSLITVYPNPTSGEFQLEIPENAGKATIRISDSMGRLVSLERVEEDTNLIKEISGPAGLYFIEVTTEKGETNRIKLIKK